MRRHRGIAIAAVAALLVVLTAACGGGGGDGVAFEGETVRSGDGVLTLEIPAGAAADGVEIEVTRIADGELPPELRGVDGVVVVGYELGPDGAQFSAPVTLTFRVDPADHGLDLPEGAVPLGLLLTENAAGDLESVAGEVSHEDGEIVVRAAVTHFSPALLVLSIHEAVALEPAKIELTVGGSREVKFVTRDPITGDTIELPNDLLEDESDWTTTPPFQVIRSERLTATISCTAPTDGWVVGAYRVLVPTYLTAFFDEQAEFFGTIAGLRGVLGAFGEPLGVKLAGDGKCDALSGAATVSPTATPSPPRSEMNPQYNVFVSGVSGSVDVNTEDCFDADAPIDDCPPSVDIAGVSWERVDGSPNLLAVTVRFVGPFVGPTKTTADIEITGSARAFPTGTVLIVGGENPECSFFGSDGPRAPLAPLAGESCEVNAAGEIEVIRDVGGLVDLKIEVTSTQVSGDTFAKDTVKVRGLEQP